MAQPLPTAHRPRLRLHLPVRQGQGHVHPQALCHWVAAHNNRLQGSWRQMGARWPTAVITQPRAAAVPDGGLDEGTMGDPGSSPYRSPGTTVDTPRCCFQLFRQWAAPINAAMFRHATGSAILRLCCRSPPLGHKGVAMRFNLKLHWHTVTCLPASLALVGSLAMSGASLSQASSRQLAFSGS